MGGVKVGRYLQTYSKKDFGPRFGFAYDLGGNGRTVLRGGVGVFWNFTPGGTSSSEGAEPAVPAVDGADLELPAHAQDFGRAAAAARRGSFASGRRQHPLHLRHQLPRRLLHELQPEHPEAARTELSRRDRLRGIARSRHVGQGESEPGPARPRRAQRGHQPALHRGLPGPPRRGTGQQHGLPELQRAAGEVPAAVRERVLVPELVHLRPGHRPQLRQRRRRDPGQRVRPRLQPRSRGLRRQAHVRVELGVRVALRQGRTASSADGR
jgi:hypothetical protein